MRRMATQALGRIAMGQMAFVTGQFFMGIGNPLIHRHHPGVATQAGVLDGADLGEIKLQGTVTMVTGSAIRQGIVGFIGSRMAHTAIDLGLLAFGRVLEMAFGTGDFGLMFAAVTGEFLDHAGMTGRANLARVFHFRQGFTHRRMGRMAVGAVAQGVMSPLRRRMAVGAGGNLAVVGVATGAAHFFMGAALFGDGRRRFGMAGAAERSRNVCSINRFTRRMGFMTKDAIFGGHRIAVGSVTIEAGFGLTVFRMAFAATAEVFFMGRTGSGKGLHRFGMTHGTGRGRHVGFDFLRRRRMGRMATQAILISHGLVMPFVAIETGHGFAVFRVAGGTFQLGVGAGGFLHLLPRSGMAGNAGRPGVLHFRQGLGQGRMGIMAGGAAFYRKVSFFLGAVAVGAGGQLTLLRRMSSMTFPASAHVAMGAARLLDRLDDRSMATGAGLRRLGRIHA